MEPKSRRNCDLCNEESNNQNLQYSCSHSFCYDCFPYLILAIIHSQGITSDLLQNPNLEFLCLICQKGHLNLPFEKISTYISEKQFNSKTISLSNKEINPKICESCERNQSLYDCRECDQFYCETCLVSSHEKNKKFSQHEIVNLEHCNLIQNKVNKQILCKCTRKKPLDFFCLDCKGAFCKLCAGLIHINHCIKPLREILRENQINMGHSQKLCKNLLDSFKKLKENLLKRTKEKIETFNEDFNLLIYQIIDALRRMKEKNKEYCDRSFKKLENQLFLIESSISQINEDFISQNQDKNSFHPNKTFQLSQFIKNTLDKKIIVNEPENKDEKDQNESLKEIHRILFEDFHEFDLNLVYDFKESGVFFADNIVFHQNKTNIFKSDPVKALKKRPITLPNNLDFFWYPAKVSASFIINEESFIIWPGNQTKKKYFPLYVYNLTTMNIETILEGTSSYFTLISTYPKYNGYDSQKLIYTSDNEGQFKIYSIDEDKKFSEMHKFNINTGKGIASAIIIEDRFHELGIYGENNVGYAIICPNDVHMNIRIYKIKKEGRELIREVKNPLNNICYCLNYYYDENKSKTKVFFGFSDSFIQIYDLKNDAWLIERFQTETFVRSISFFEQKINGKTKEDYLIFSQNNAIITLANINKGILYKKIVIPNVLRVLDFCEWDKFLILTTQDKNFIKVVNLETFELMFSKEMEDVPILNIIKVLKNEKKLGTIKECIICLEACYEKSRINIFE